MRVDLYMAVGRWHLSILCYGIALKAVTNVSEKCANSIFRAVVKNVKYRTRLLEHKVVEMGKIVVMAKFGNPPVPFRTEHCYTPAPQ